MAGVVRDDVAVWRENFVAALKASRQAPDAERPRRVLAPFGGSRLIAEPSRVERRSERDPTASATEWRPIARG